MKKITLSLIGLLAFASYAQKPISKMIEGADNSLVTKDLRSEKIYDEAKPFNGAVVPIANRANTSEDIGNTTYDLQTNSSNQRRIVNHGDGTLSAVFTFGQNSGSSFTDRGAGYNYYDGTSWGAHPTARIETTRNGWPSLTTSGGDEIIISHSGTGGLTLNKRSTKGTGSWIESVIPTSLGTDILWPRAAIGGLNDSTIHLIAIAGNDTTFSYQGLETGALVYYRSPDLGNTWDIADSVIPGFDTSNYLGHGGDSYAIDARKNVVAISYFPGWSDLITVKSTDNGDTWTTYVVNDFPVDKYEADQGFDLDSNAVQDSTLLFTTDGSGSVLIDNNDNLHVFFGGDFLVDWDLTDGNTSHFPLTDVLGYWNESFGNDSVWSIAEYLDYNNDDTVITGQLNGGSIQNNPEYRVSGLSMPSAGISADGKLYVTYAAFAELHTNGTTNYRHIYCIKSNDGGLTWTEPRDFTPDANYDLYENVFPSMARLVDDKVHIVFQRDQITGTFVVDAGSASYNEIIYLGLDSALNRPYYAGVEESTTINAALYPNPATSELFIKLQSEVRGKVTIEVLDAMGRVILSEGSTITNNTSLVQLNLDGIKNGAYNVVIRSDKAITSKTFIKQ